MTPFYFSPSRPFVPLAAAFALGIAAAGLSLSLCILALAGALVFAVTLPAARTRMAAIGAQLGFAAAGVLWQHSATLVPSDDVSRWAGGPYVTIRGSVADEPEPGARSLKALIAVRMVEQNGSAEQRSSGFVLAFLPERRDGPGPCFGDAVEVRGRIEAPEPATNPGGFDERAYLAHRGIFSVLRVRRAESWRARTDGSMRGGGLPRLAGVTRASLREVAGRYLPPVDASLLGGILLGSRTDLPREVGDDFQLTGTAHILATAGLHVGLVSLVLFTALRACRLSRRSSAAVIMTVLLLYAVAAGGRPAVVRAVVVAEVFLGGYLLQREPDAANSLALAALALLAYRPGSLFEAGFQLSFATVGTLVGLLSIARPYLDRWMGDDRIGRPGVLARVRVRFAEMLLLTVGAQVGSAPLVAEYFNLVSPSGPLANALIVPALALIIGFGLALWAAGALGAPLIPDVAAAVLHPLLSFVMWAVRTCSRLPLAAIPVSSPGPVGIALYYAAVAAGVGALRRRAVAANRVPEPATDTAEAAASEPTPA